MFDKDELVTGADKAGIAVVGTVPDSARVSER